MDTNQQARAHRLQALHAGSTFVIANAWDGGSARILASLVSRLLPLRAVRPPACWAASITASTSKNLSPCPAHLRFDRLAGVGGPGKGFGDAPADAARAILRAAEVGLVGGSIEDATGRREQPIFDVALATERVAAAVEAARSLPFPFALTARAENFLNGRSDLDDTIRRLQAYERAGADVLFAPALPDLAAVRTVCASLSKPVSFMACIPGKSFSVAELTAVGVRRISFATSLYRAAMGGLVEAAREIQGSARSTASRVASPARSSPTTEGQSGMTAGRAARAAGRPRRLGWPRHRRHGPNRADSLSTGARQGISFRHGARHAWPRRCAVPT
jgi:2-methylisocitrate lyase-like PEP mutase family enzyme